jgi:hypothetical protein
MPPVGVSERSGRDAAAFRDFCAAGLRAGGRPRAD